MSKKHFIELADYIREANIVNYNLQLPPVYNAHAIRDLADFCKAQNPRFDRARWLGYIAGENGPNGGRVKGKDEQEVRA